MNTLAQEREVSKLLAMTDNVVVRNRAYSSARSTDQAARQYGRLSKSINDLAETAEKVRKGGQP